MNNRIYSIGHSTHSMELFVSILQGFNIELVVDVRSIPRSRRNPQFNTDILGPDLGKHGIRYLHLKELGGLRHTTTSSVNTGWTNLSFRGFADYMQTPEFAKAIETLTGISNSTQTVIMCAEALPWRCHRSLIADALVVRSIAVEHIMNRSTIRTHTLTPRAKVSGSVITYP